MAEFVITGTKELEAKLKAIAAAMPSKIGVALYREAQIEMTESKKRVPVDTGALRSSGVVQKPVSDGNATSVTLGYGGPSVDYAFKVHEDLEAFHKVGQAKYLESVLMESAPNLLQRIANRLDVMAAKAAAE